MNADRAQSDGGRQRGRDGGGGGATRGVLGHGRAGSEDGQEDVGDLHCDGVS